MLSQIFMCSLYTGKSRNTLDTIKPGDLPNTWTGSSYAGFWVKWHKTRVIRHCLVLYQIASLKGSFLLSKLLFVAEQVIAPSVLRYEVKWEPGTAKGLEAEAVLACVNELYIFFFLIECNICRLCDCFQFPDLLWSVDGKKHPEAMGCVWVEAAWLLKTGITPLLCYFFNTREKGGIYIPWQFFCLIGMVSFFLIVDCIRIREHWGSISVIMLDFFIPLLFLLQVMKICVWIVECRGHFYAVGPKLDFTLFIGCYLIFSAEEKW